MYLKNLLAAVADLHEMPVEVEDMASALIDAGCQDSIIFHPVDADAGTLQGVFYQYTTKRGVYAAPDFVTLIVYSENLSIDWQRMVCCKELIHACDKVAEQTNTPEEVQSLLDKVLGPLTTEDLGLPDLMALKDKLAIYQALAILFPLTARDQALEKIKQGVTPEEIARWVCLPLPLVTMVLDADWPSIRQDLLDGWGE